MQLRVFSTPACSNLLRSINHLLLLPLQALTLLTMVTAAKLHAHPLERALLLLPFFLGSAEIVSGVTGL